MLRLDRFATLHFFRRIVELRSNSKGEKIPILMYHSISNDTELNVHSYFRLNTSPTMFSKHMKYLKENKYKIINLNNLEDLEQYNKTESGKLVIITFDDGYEDFLTNAYPILNEYGFTATVFLASDYVGKIFKGKKCLSWQQVNILKEKNINFGSHTMSHPILYNLSKDMIEYEIQKSKQIIEDRIGCGIDSFCYPYAFPQGDSIFKNYFENILRNSGYKLCSTTTIGRISPIKSFYLERLPINSDDDLEFFEAKLIGAYDWLYFFQYGYKNMKNFLRKNSKIN